VNTKQHALGFAVVDETPSGAVAIERVSVGAEQTLLTGAWLLEDPTRAQVDSLISQWIIVGTRDGIARISKILSQEVRSADLRSLIAACRSAENEIVLQWQAHKDAEPAKRAKLVPLDTPTWPVMGEIHEDATTVLATIRVAATPPGCDPEMRDVLALARLTQYVANAWQGLESDRLSRRYLAVIEPERSRLPASWLRENPCYWP
jgi:hypothetical protein